MLELVVERKAQLVGVKIDLHSGVYRASNKAKVEEPAKQIDAVKNNVGFDAVGARGGRLESASRMHS